MKGRRNELTRELIINSVVVDPVTGCWVCRDVNRRHGYGQIKVNYKNWRAHRASWKVFKGPIPRGKNVLHECDNRPCANPEHLFLGTQLDNVEDMIAKGRCRPPRGDSHGNSKLRASDIPRIRELVKKHHIPRKKVASMYRVSEHAITDVVLGRRWAHVPSEVVASGK